MLFSYPYVRQISTRAPLRSSQRSNLGVQSHSQDDQSFLRGSLCSVFSGPEPCVQQFCLLTVNCFHFSLFLSFYKTSFTWSFSEILRFEKTTKIYILDTAVPLKVPFPTLSPGTSHQPSAYSATQTISSSPSAT